MTLASLSLLLQRESRQQQQSSHARVKVGGHVPVFTSPSHSLGLSLSLSLSRSLAGGTGLSAGMRWDVWSNVAWPAGAGVQVGTGRTPRHVDPSSIIRDSEKLSKWRLQPIAVPTLPIRRVEHRHQPLFHSSSSSTSLILPSLPLARASSGGFSTSRRWIAAKPSGGELLCSVAMVREALEASACT